MARAHHLVLARAARLGREIPKVVVVLVYIGDGGEGCGLHGDAALTTGAVLLLGRLLLLLPLLDCLSRGLMGGEEFSPGLLPLVLPVLWPRSLVRNQHLLTDF